MRKTGSAFILFAFCWMPLLVQAGETPVQIAAAADTDTVYLLETFTYQISVLGGGRNMPEPVFTTPEGFKIVGGPSTSTEFKMVNGLISNKVVHIYRLQAVREGKWTLPPVTAVYRGTTIRSNPVTIDVIKYTTHEQSSIDGVQGGSDASGIPKDRVSDLFIWAVPDRSEVYLGESLGIRYELYTRVNVSNYQVSQQPAFTGFWTEEVRLPQSPQVVRRKIHGAEFSAVKIYEANLYPTVVGELTIDPLAAVIEVQGRDPFDDFMGIPFGTRMGTRFFNARQETRSSQSLTIHVKPLPDAGKSADFSGAVGRYEISAEVSKPVVQEGEGVTVRLTLTGNQSLKMITPPAISMPADFKLFEPKAEDEIYLPGNDGSRSRTFEYVMVPYRQGDYSVPPVQFHYFDPEKQSYQAVTTQPISIHVNPAPAGSLTSSPVEIQEDRQITLLNRDIRYIKTNARILNSRRLYRSPAFIGVMVFPIVLTPLIWIYGRHRRRLTGDEAYARSFRARTESLHRLRKAVELQKSGHFDQSVDALASAVTQYMADRLNLPAASLSLRQIEQCLSQEKKVHVDIEELQKLWISIETLRFAPVAPTSDAVESLISESRRLLEKYENMKFPKRKSRTGADR